MKIVGLEIKEIRIDKFFPSKKEVELAVSFNDGSDQTIARKVDASNPERETERVLKEITEMVTKAHKADRTEQVNLVVKEEDKLQKEIPPFLETIHRQLQDIQSKKDADGYLDLIRELQKLRLEF